MNPLEKRYLGKSGVELPVLGFGGAQLSSQVQPTGESQAQETLDAAWKSGIRYFDTSPWYGLGLSEHRIGHFLRQQPRDQFLLSTKVGRVMSASIDTEESQTPPYYQGGLPFVHRYDYTYDGVMRSFEDSTQRLGLNQLDLLLIHDLDYRFNETEAELNARLKELESGWKALDQLKSGGRIRGIGAGINEEKVIMKLLDGFDLDFFLVAMPYTLLDQKTLEREFPRFEQRNIGVIIGSPFASGILAAGPDSEARYGGHPVPPEINDRIRAIERVCRRHDVSIKAAALQFPLGHAVVTSIIPGVKHPTEVQENVDMIKAVIPQDFWSELRDEGLIHKLAPVPHG
jgi:D-threo-aldose 1-dehydrogenase